MEKNNIKPSVFTELASIDVMPYAEEKQDLLYLSWAIAWKMVKERYPDANYELTYWDNKPYLFDEKLGYLVQTKVTINGETIQMQLPVMDNANKPMKAEPYKYKVREYAKGRFTGNYIERTCEAATMFDINTAIMRCLVKNLAMFGLGISLYMGETIGDTTNAESNTINKDNNEKKYINNDILDKYLTLNTNDFPLIKGQLKFNKKEELISYIEKHFELTEEQKNKIKNLK